MDFTGKRATLIGLGTRTHVSLARFLVSRGAEVTISDVKPAEKLEEEIRLLGDLPVRMSLGGHRDEDVVSADVVFVTPGASRDLPCLVATSERGIPIRSEIELLFHLCESPIVAITGSSGKTTTTTLTGEILKAQGRRVFVGGNIGMPLIDRLDEIGLDSVVVLELSSFQLEHMTDSPHVAAILNVTPNHLDRHVTMENYANAKKNIILYQKPDDYAILGVDDPIAGSLWPECRGNRLGFSLEREVESGGFLWSDELLLRYGGREELVCRTGDVKLRGRHNLYNVLAAAAISAAAGADTDSIRQVVTTFTGVEHRLELVREIRGARYYNDSIATAPERTLAALNAYDEPIVLIFGGKSKHLPMEKLIEKVNEKVRALVLMS